MTEKQQLYPQLIIDALKSVRYPGEEGNIVSGGMLQDDIRISGNQVTFSIRFKKAKDPFYKSILKASEAALKREIGSHVDVAITPLFPEVPQSQAQEAEQPLSGVKNIIAVSSGKGGVGKSTITTNLAVALAQMGYKVGLLDADIYGPSIPRMMNVEEARPVLVTVGNKELIDPVLNYGVKMLSIGFFVQKENAIIWRGSMASNAIGQLIREGNWGELDFLLVDLPPGTSDIHLTLIQTLGITGAIVVTTPQSVSTDDARKGISMFQDEKINVPVLGVVENMSWFTPAELPDNKYFIFGEGGGRRLAEETGTKLLAQIPLVQSVREAADKGTPIALNTETIMGIAFGELAERLVEAVNERNATLAPTHKVEVNVK
ncbi:MAG: Mrp/NBP35 family ATP-binding protein [Porphyromonas sp.]|nr:Mrp/NBP35 family ATP-binding protein [Bacteroidales bacterium]MDY3100597.1 Mrp/NBP35 family ATP-binding protein [Porphyromonas sp.]